MKRFLGIAIAAVMTISSISFVSASISIESAGEKNIDGLSKFVYYVQEVVTKNDFVNVDSSNPNVSYSIRFSDEKVYYTYKNIEKTYYFAGTYSVSSQDLSISFTDVYSSNKFGFYQHEDLSASPIKVESNLSIKNDGTYLDLSNDSIPHLNVSFVSLNKKFDNTSINKVILSKEESTSFVSNKSWRFEDGNSKFGFDNLYFSSKDKVYLSDESNPRYSGVLEASYSIKDGILKISPLKFYRINKFENSINIRDFSKKYNVDMNQIGDIYTDANNLSFNIYYDKTNDGYYIGRTNSDAGKEAKIVTIKTPEIKFEVGYANESFISSKIVGKTIKLGTENSSEANFKFNSDKTFTARFINSKKDTVVNGTYSISNNSAKLSFKEMEYFSYSGDVEALHKTPDSETINATIDFRILNGNVLIGNFLAPNFEDFNYNLDNSIYMAFVNTENPSIKSLPEKIKDGTLSGLVNGKTFTLDNPVKDEKIIISLKNNYANISIENNGILEYLDGTYEIKNGEIRITNKNDLYRHGDYDNFIFTEEMNLRDKTSSIVIYPLRNESTKEIYFALYNGARFGVENSETEATFKKSIELNGPYYKYIEENYNDNKQATFTDLDKKSIEKSIFNKNYFIYYNRTDSTNNVVQKVSFNSNGSVKVLIEDKVNGNTILDGTYTINENGKVYVKFTSRYTEKNGLYSKIATDYDDIITIVQNDSDKSLYLNLVQDVYLKLNPDTAGDIIKLPSVK